MLSHLRSNRRVAETQRKIGIRHSKSEFEPVSRKRPHLISASLGLCGLFLFLVIAGYSQAPSPQSVLGFHPTDDRTIADWKQITDYFARLDKGSDRVLVR